MSKRTTIERNISQDITTKKYYIMLYYKDELGNKVRKTETANTIKEARDIRDKHEAAVKLNLVKFSPDSTNMTLSQCLNNYIEIANLEYTTAYGYSIIINYINKYGLGKKKISSLKKNDILLYIKAIKQNTTLSNASINKHLDFMKTALNNAYQNELIVENIMNKVKKLEVSRDFKGDYYTIEECQSLFSALENYQDYRITIPVYLAVYCGLRRGEICGLKWDAINFENETISIFQTRVQAGKKFIVKKTKTIESNRTLKMELPVSNLLKQYQKYQQNLIKQFGSDYDNQGYIVTDKLGKPVRPTYISDLYKAFLEKYNLRHIRFHDLRHTFISLAYQNNISLMDIAKAAGHASTKMAQQVYIHLDANSTNNVMKTIANVLDKDKSTDSNKF